MEIVLEPQSSPFLPSDYLKLKLELPHLDKILLLKSSKRYQYKEDLTFQK
jgi:hypothetical protein